METVIIWNEIEDNIFRLESYYNSTEYIEDYYNLMKNGICFVVFERSGRLFFGPSRFVGYKNNNIDDHRKNPTKHGRETNDAISRIITSDPEEDDILEHEYKKYCLSIGLEPSPTGTAGNSRKYWFYGNREVRSSLETDMVNILGQNITTEKEQEILCRIGQGQFRKSLIKLWKKCSVTSFGQINILRASHIKPWRVSSNHERLDKYNGFLLIPNLDVAFDKGVISFDNDGNILISSKYDYLELEKLNINVGMKINLKEENKKYLEYHRKNVFIK